MQGGGCVFHIQDLYQREYSSTSIIASSFECVEGLNDVVCKGAGDRDYNEACKMHSCGIDILLHGNA